MPRPFATLLSVALVLALSAFPFANAAPEADEPLEPMAAAEKAEKSAPTASEAPATTSDDPLVRACLDAKSAFQPITDDDLAGAKSEAVEAVDALDARFREEEDGAAAWRAYLHFEDLQRELGKAVPDFDIIQKSYQRLADDDQEALRYVWFLNAREALFRMLALRQAKDDPNLAATYEKNLDMLAAALAEEKTAPSPRTRARIGRLLGWLEIAGQAPRVTKRIRKRFGCPNLYVWCSGPFLNEAVSRTVCEPTDVVDCILGTRVRGHGTTAGEVAAELVPCNEGALVDVRFTGNTATENVGVNGPATIYSSADTDFVAVKRLFVDRDGISCFPSVSTAVTRSTFKAICTKSPLRIVKRIATNRAYQQKALGERIASQHAEARLNRQVDEQFDDQLAEANHSYKTRLIRPLRKFRLSPESIGLSTTGHRLHCRLRQARFDQIAAGGAPPAAADGRVGFQVHESAFNNSASSALGGVFLMEEEFHSIVKDLLGELPKRLEEEKAEKPWGIDFSQDRPMWIEFADGTIRFGIRARRFVQGDETHPGMAVVVTYRIDRTDGGVTFLREEEFDITPLDFAGREEQRLSAKETTIKTLLQRRFEKLFEKKLVAEPLTFEGEWEKAGPLTLKRLEAKDGWLVGEYDK